MLWAHPRGILRHLVKGNVLYLGDIWRGKDYKDMASCSIRLRSIVMDLPPASAVMLKDKYNFHVDEEDRITYAGTFNATVLRDSPINKDGSHVAIHIADVDNAHHVSAHVWPCHFHLTHLKQIHYKIILPPSQRCYTQATVAMVARLWNVTVDEVKSMKPHKLPKKLQEAITVTNLMAQRDNLGGYPLLIDQQAPPPPAQVIQSRPYCHPTT